MRVVAKAVGIRTDKCRLWVCCSRENKTFRPESAFQGPFLSSETVESVSASLRVASRRMLFSVERKENGVVDF